MVLVINRVSRGRFFLALLLGGAELIIEALVWILSVWVLGGFWPDRGPRSSTPARHRPCVRTAGARDLHLFPVRWSADRRLLRLWVLLAAVVGISVVFGVAPWLAALIAALGFLGRWVLLRIFGGVGNAVGRWFWRASTGLDSPLRSSDPLITLGSQDRHGMILDLLFTLIGVALVGVLVIGLLAPVESLRWWAGFSGEEDVRCTAGAASVADGAQLPGARPGDRLPVGIGSISGDELLKEEADFLDLLAPLVPGAVIVRDVFPYSAAGVGLTGTRVFSNFWQLLDRMRLRGDALLSSLINLRNMFQVAVAADPRYGPIFAYGVSRVIAREAYKAGFRRGGDQRLVLLGYSGGAQVAVSAAPFLKRLLGTSVHVISLGGVLDSDPGLRVVSRLDHLVGDKDIMERIGRIVYPGRWPIARASAWNAARSTGVVEVKHAARHGPQYARRLHGPQRAPCQASAFPSSPPSHRQRTLQNA